MTKKGRTSNSNGSTEMIEDQISQQLSSVIKASRDIMRKDKGLSSDVERLPMLTWIMFLKFLDDVEQHREVEAELRGNIFNPIIDPPYRWRDWASPNIPTGQDLLAFIEQEETELPNGEHGPGLFPYLRNLRDTEDINQRDVIASIFQETYNRMTKGYLLKDILLKFDSLDFGSSKQIDMMGRLYELMLKEMRDAAGAAGEFYTPRPVIQFMVEVISPKLGETILDPAVGTGGFLVESFKHMKSQCSKAEHIEVLQTQTLHGIEAKALPYLLCNMNLLLHGIDPSGIIKANSLSTPLREIGDKERVDIILTNPPFGGEEERSILRNFPKDLQTTDTALLFLQLVIRKLTRMKGKNVGGRCGIILPDGVLFGSGVASRLRQLLLKDFNLHTIVRLPNGVFAPYTGIRTNILFFERNGTTKGIWYYNIPLPDGRKTYTKTRPMKFEEFAPCLEWSNQKSASSNSWYVKIDDIIEPDYNLDRKNPNKNEEIVEYDPLEIVRELISVNKEIEQSLTDIEHLLK